VGIHTSHRDGNLINAPGASNESTRFEQLTTRGQTRLTDQLPNTVKILTLSLLFLVQGFSLCLFYNYAFYGQVWWPLMSPLAFLTPLFYYLAMSQWMPAFLQAILWHVGALVCGWCWAISLRRPLSQTFPALTLSCLILALPAPWLAYYHALTPSGPDWNQFLKACLVRNFAVQPPAGLVGIYHCLAVLAWLTEASLLRHPDGRLPTFKHLALAPALAFVAVNLLGWLTGQIVMRLWS